MTRKKALLFPYTIENCDIVKHRNLLTNYVIVGVDTFTLELKGKDISYVYNGKPEGITIGHVTLDYDVLLLGDGSILNENFDEVYAYAKKAAQKGKDISIIYSLSKEQKEIFKELCEKNNVKFRIYSGLNVPEELLNVDYENLNDIPVPIVFVSGVAERTGKFEIQLILNEYFNKSGYKVTQIGTKNFCELFGFYSFPHFMYEEMSEVKKIVCFNELCKGFVEQEKPDIFIIGVPGSLIPYNNYFTSKFGVFAFELGKAIRPDSVIIALDNAPYENEGIRKINQVCKVYFGNEATAFSMLNSRIDVEKSIQEKEIGYIISDEENTCKNVSRIRDNSKITIFNASSLGKLNELAAFIEKDLSDMDIKLL